MSNQKSSPKAEWTSRHASAYSEAGNMLRHYSSSRTAVLTVVLPICLGILGWVLAVRVDNRLAIYLLMAEVLVFSYAVTLSLFFSAKYEQTRRFLVRLEKGGGVAVYNTIASRRLRGKWHLDAVDKSMVIIGLLLHIAFYSYYFSR